jgi:two-component system, NarL family, invasion response regulator UvrY
MTSVLVIDDHPFVLQGCRCLLEGDGVTTILEAADAATGYELFCRHRPDIVIVDLALRKSNLDGLSLIRRLKSHDPQARILVFSMHSDRLIISRALEAGAAGYILKDTASEDLIKIFEAVREGKSNLSCAYGIT